LRTTADIASAGSGRNQRFEPRITLINKLNAPIADSRENGARGKWCMNVMQNGAAALVAATVAGQERGPKNEARIIFLH
jgi:hypothetical protein